MPSVHVGDLWYTSGMNIKHLFAAAVAAALAIALPAASEDFARHVNPSVGCTFNGHCFAAAAYPFGLVQAGPDCTRPNGYAAAAKQCPLKAQPTDGLTWRA